MNILHPAHRAMKLRDERGTPLCFKKQIPCGNDNKKCKSYYFVGGSVVTVRVVRPWIQRAGRAPSVLMS